MDGLFIKGSRPKSKKAVKETLAESPESVSIEATSMFGGYSGPVTEAPDGKYPFVGPDPYTKRSFYGTLTVKDGKVALK